MSSVLLTDDSWCELSSEAEGRDLTPVSFGQIPADMPMDVSAFLLRALGAGRRAGWSTEANDFSERRKLLSERNGKDEGSDGLVHHDSLNLLLHAAVHETCVRLELCTLSPLLPVMEGALSLPDAEQAVWNQGAGSSLRPSRWTLKMPNCNPISLHLVASLFSAACVLTLTATLIISLYSSRSLCSHFSCLLKVLQ